MTSGVEAFEPAGAVIASKIGWRPELGLGRCCLHRRRRA